MVADARPSPSNSDTRVGRLAVQEGWIRDEDVEKCLKEQQRLRRSGASVRLGQLLIQQDLISTTQLVKLLEKQKEIRDGRGPVSSG